jgi:hypothetical protein
MFQRNSYRIKALNTINFAKSMRYNPFSYIQDETDILTLVTTFTSNTKGEQNDGDAFWEKAETLLYTVLIAYMLLEQYARNHGFRNTVHWLSLREMDMFIFAICMPVVVVIILRAVFGNRAAFDGAEYTFLEQFFGAVSTIAICAGGVMGLPLVVSDYRSRKILKRFKVTPTRPALILAVQVVHLRTLFDYFTYPCLCNRGNIFRLSGIRLMAPILRRYLLLMLSMFSIGLLVGGIAPNINGGDTLVYTNIACRGR